MLKDRLDDARRFARFVRREAADYHDPPETPVEAMWAGIEARLGAASTLGSRGVTDDAADAAAGAAADIEDGLAGVGGSVDHPFDVLGYHDPPSAPREAMWERIEAEWVARQPEDPGARKATRGPLRLVVARTLGRPGRTTVWLTGAAAASVALAVALDRGAQLPVSAEPETVATATAAAPVTATPLAAAATDSGPLAPTAAEEALALSVVEEPLETNRQFATADPPPPADQTPTPTPSQPEADPPVRAAATSPSQRTVGITGRASADEYDMSRHLDRAAALLVAFRTDIGTDESQGDLARWAREVLVETRSLLDRPVGRGERERALLQDLELVLVQIARLGPEAPDFERDLARESMERQGTLMRLRSASGT